MATFRYEERDLYYEDMGSGEPLLVLNGVFMSCESWKLFERRFTEKNRLLLLDFPDQGKSAKMDREYTQDLPAGAAGALIEHLGLSSVNLAGISYGGEVAMKLASLRPEKVKRLVLANTTAYTSPWLRDIGHSWEYACKSYDGHQFFKTCIPIIYSPWFYEKNYEWCAAREETFVKTFAPEVYDSFARLIRSAEFHDERENLRKITASTLVISSEYDYVTPLCQQRELVDLIPEAVGHVVIEGCGHASMYEKPSEFASLLLGFVNGSAEVRVA
ncbi:MAG: alpha/beta hydrolase [Synergistaceae bacterium]|jgi:pimeloyl-ACP methyl ester carboxylesterase|nr:alpha/beta hydrolase [Synergistaceae bacterium]